VRFVPFTLLDVFAARPLEGTLHAVVDEADGIGARTMATVARRLRLPETSFLQASDSPTADYRHRIFTIAGEIPFAGHPSLGAGAVWCRRRGRPRTEVVQSTGAGEQRLEVALDGRSGEVAIHQNPPVFGLEMDAAALLEGLGLPPDAGDRALPPQLVSTGLATLVVPLAEHGTLSRIRFDWARLAPALAPLTDVAALNCYVVARRDEGRWSARCFAQDIGGGEDPATGSAAGPLGAYLRERIGTEHVVVDQGVDLGSPSRLTVDTRDGIRVSGTVHLLGEGEMTLPEVAGPD
jgi:trans-2,3-dihydro-3-hydroxyanthranilate isomerase